MIGLGEEEPRDETHPIKTTDGPHGLSRRVLLLVSWLRWCLIRVLHHKLPFPLCPYSVEGSQEGQPALTERKAKFPLPEGAACVCINYLEFLWGGGVSPPPFMDVLKRAFFHQWGLVDICLTFGVGIRGGFPCETGWPLGPLPVWLPRASDLPPPLCELSVAFLPSAVTFIFFASLSTCVGRLKGQTGAVAVAPWSPAHQVQAQKW